MNFFIKCFNLRPKMFEIHTKKYHKINFLQHFIGNSNVKQTKIKSLKFV